LIIYESPLGFINLAKESIKAELGLKVELTETFNFFKASFTSYQRFEAQKVWFSMKECAF
jgi:hypothetical protein